MDQIVIAGLTAIAGIPMRHPAIPCGMVELEQVAGAVAHLQVVLLGAAELTQEVDEFREQIQFTMNREFKRPIPSPT